MHTDRPPVARTLTSDMTLEAVVARLGARREVAGLLLMGSTATDTLTVTSDYDLLVVFVEPPVPLRMVNTWVEGRFTEVYCTTIAVVDQLPSSAAPLGSETWVLQEWVREGRIVYDPTGRLAVSQQALRQLAPAPTIPDADAYAAWREVGYNVVHMRRYLDSPEGLAPTVVDVRMLYSLMEVLLRYFTVRGLPWRGETAALRYLEAADGEFLELLESCLSEPDRPRRVEMYAALAARAVSPVGPLWGEGDTVVQPGQAWGSEGEPAAGDVRGALAFWQSLVTPVQEGRSRTGP